MNYAFLCISEGCEAPGRYGSDCDLICPTHCYEQKCHFVNGSCMGCDPGWTGDFCNKSRIIVLFNTVILYVAGK
jgi:hypothetical protein